VIAAQNIATGGPAPVLTTQAQVVLLGLWAVTAWVGAGLVAAAAG
jgi:hypothetical protein